jgi:hypothetical protein
VGSEFVFLAVNKAALGGLSVLGVSLFGRTLGNIGGWGGKDCPAFLIQPFQVLLQDLKLGLEIIRGVCSCIDVWNDVRSD